MWQSTISLRYVSYKNADSNLHERICAMAMTAKNLLWSCAQIVAPRPPINPQRPNHAIGGWITEEWEPFISPLLAFGSLGTAWWYLLGWSAGRGWMFLRSRL